MDNKISHNDFDLEHESDQSISNKQIIEKINKKNKKLFKFLLIFSLIYLICIISVTWIYATLNPSNLSPFTSNEGIAESVIIYVDLYTGPPALILLLVSAIMLFSDSLKHKS